MPNMSKQYQLMLGTFIDNEFVWHDVDSYEDLETAYAEFKKYVNSQLKYTDEELIKVWNTGRLDVELRRGNRLLNWVGIYAREVDRLSKEDEEEADKDKPEKQETKDSDFAFDDSWEAKEIGNRITDKFVTFTPEQFDEVLKLAESGMPTTKIAQRLNLSPYVVGSILTQYRYRPETIQYRPVEFENKVRELYNAGKTIAELVKETGKSYIEIQAIVDPERVRSLKKAGYERRLNDPEKSQRLAEEKKKHSAKRAGERIIGRGANRQITGFASGAYEPNTRQKIDEAEKKYILKLAEEGLNATQIATKVGRTEGTILKFIERNKGEIPAGSETRETKDSAPKGRPARRICPYCYQELESRGERDGKWKHVDVDDTDPVESLCDMCGESGYDELYVRDKVKVGDVVLFTPEQRKKVLELAEEGNYNLTQLAIHAGVSKPQARLILKNKDNPDAFDYGYHPSDEEIKEIKELARHGYSPAKIARTLGGGATVPAIKKILESEKK